MCANPHRSTWPLLCILLLGSVLRLAYLSEVPNGFYRDEAAIGYDAFSILKTGRDHWGETFPLFARSLGDYDEALYRYLVVPFIPLFGLTEFSTRLPAALTGILTIWALHSLAGRMFGPRTALLAALFLAISPWHIQFSRWAVRAILLPLFLCVGLSSFLKGVQKPGYLWWSALAFAVCLHTYNAARVFVPLFVIGLVVIYWKALRNHGWRALPPALLFLGVLALLAPFWISPEGMVRARSTLVDSPLAVLSNYLSYFDPVFLFWRGDSNPRHSLFPMGQLHYLECLTVLSGLYALGRRKHPANAALWFWLLLYPIPSALTAETHAIRSIAGAPLFALLSGYGVHALGKSIRNTRRSVVLSAIGAILLTGNLALYCKFYFLDYPKASWQWWQYGIGDAINYVESSNLPCVIAEPQPFFAPSYIFVLFFTRFSPEIYHSLPREPKETNWEGSGAELGKYHISDQVDAIARKGPCLLLVGPEMYRRFTQSEYPYRLVHTVAVPGDPDLMRIGVLYTPGRRDGRGRDSAIHKPGEEIAR